MAWQIEIDEAAKKELGKLDPQVARRVIQFLRTRLQNVKIHEVWVKPLKAQHLATSGNTD